MTVSQVVVRVSGSLRLPASMTALVVVVVVPIALGAATRHVDGFSVAMASDDPLEWGDYGRALARFRLRVTNIGDQPDAYIVSAVEAPSNFASGAFGWVYSPTPTLPLQPGESGFVYVWLSGFEQPPPAGPAAGDYTATIRLRGTVSDGGEQAIEATVRRSFSAEPAQGTVSGSVTDSDGARVSSGTVTLGDPESVRVVDLSTSIAGGRYSIEAPAGTYWLWIDAAGFRSAFSRVTVTAGARTAADVSLATNDVTAGATDPSVVVDAGLPTYRAAMTADLTRIATLPGFYTRGGNSKERLQVYDGGGDRLLRAPVPAPAELEFDVGEWTSSDHGLDLSADGSLVAMGTAGGTIEVYDVGAKERLWMTDRAGDDNPLVPGPLGEGLLRSSEVRFSPDGTLLAAGSLAGYVYLFDAFDGTLSWSFATPGQVRALRFSPKGDKLYVGSGGNFLYVLAVANGKQLRRTELLFWPWEHVAMDAKGRSIATGGKDGVVRVFNKKGKLRWSAELPGFVMGYEFSPNGKQLFVNHGPTGVYAFDKKGRVEWYRRETMGSGKLFVDAGGNFLGYCQVSPSRAPALRVLQHDGTLVWEYVGGSRQEAFFHVGFLADGSRLVATGQLDGASGQILVFDGWIR